VRLAVDELLTVLPVYDALLLNKCLHLGQVRGVTGHVCRQDYSNKPLSESLEVISGEIFEEVVFGSVEDGKRLCGVVVLLDGLVAVADGTIRDQVDMVGIGEAIVTEVVADGRHADGKSVELTQRGKGQDLALHQEDIAHLEHVDCVHVVVVLHIPSVPFIDLADKA